MDELNKILDSDLTTTNNMVKISIETVDVGKKILTNLDDQRNKLININNKNKGLSDVLIEADNNISKMESWFCFYRKKKNKNKDIYNNNNIINPTTPVNKNKIQKCNIPDERNEQINNNLDMIDNLVTEMKEQAVVMSNEIDNQNNIIDEINFNINKNKQHISKLTDRSNKLMR